MDAALDEQVTERTDAEILDRIIAGGHITPVYQPIVSLADGTVFGYEVLSRISKEQLAMDIEHMFRTADRENRAWELEALCRTKALEGAIDQLADRKLFINVNPNIIHDDSFKDGFTKSRLDRYGIDFHNVIFEITERSSILDKRAFLDAIAHYKGQNYGIAIDDVGAGYSGLNTISDVKPSIIKLDMALVRDIDKDETKQLLCKAMLDFCKNANVKCIAEGVETEEELKVLMRLGVDFAQGFFLGVPNKSLTNITASKSEMIVKHQDKRYVENSRSSIYPIIGHLAKPGYVFSPDEKNEAIYEMLNIHPVVTDIAVVEDNRAVGFLTKADFNKILGGRYGFSLYSKKMIGQVMHTDFLRVNYNMPVDQVSRFAMQRCFEQLYNPIVVEKDGRYHGVVTVKDLLDTCTKIEVHIAGHSNPLTGLPGNLMLEKEIMNRVYGKQPYCITYYDLDNFKAYNDAYGFQNGDAMLTMVAEILKKNAVRNEFVGHIGGDDFIVICDYHEGELYCKAVLSDFAEQVTALYRDEDVRNGYIVSKNRNGVTENFPLASLSIAGISNISRSYQNLEDFSRDIAKLKKVCKRHLGNYFEIH